MQLLMIVIGLIWLGFGAFVGFAGDDPLSTEDLIRFYGFHVMAHIWMVGSICYGAASNVSI
jgi:hypothetical protein